MKETNKVMFKLITLIEAGKDIPYALRNLANKHCINIEDLKEVMADVEQEQKKSKYINSESSETGECEDSDEFFQYPEAYT